MTLNTEWIEDLTQQGIEPNPGFTCQAVGCGKQNGRYSGDSCLYCKTKRSAKSLSIRLGQIEGSRTKDPKTGKNLESYEAERNAVLQSFRKKLLASISGQDGKCVICNVLNAREIDHMRPELKTLCFGDKYSIKNLEAEVARNTVDGKVQLQGLCCECHANKSKKSKRSAEETAKRNPKRTFVKEYIQNYKIEKKSCEYEKCCRRGDLCTADNVSSFELDHHHTMSCPCDECKVNPSLQKKFKISDYARNYPIGNKTKEEMRKELDTELAKCRMLHRECHQKHTIEQLKTNHKLREKRKAEEAKALADVDPTKTKRRRTS